MLTEYKATLMLRIGVLLMLSPAYLLGGFGLYHSREFDILGFMLLIIPLLIVTIVWIYYGSIRVKINERSLTKETIIRKTEVELSGDLQVFLDVRTPMGDLGNVLVKSSAKHLVSKMGSEAKLHINIVVENKGNKITLDSNIKGIASLRDKLSDVLLKNIYPDLAREYGNGKKISFGSISIQNGTLDLGSKKIDTEDIGKFETKNRKLMIGAKGKLFALAKIPTSKIPNLVCLLSLISPSNRA